MNGEGPPDLIWAPGTMSHLDLDWENPARARLFEGFGRFCRLIRFDKRGTGLSDRPIKMATLEERTDDIRAVMDAVGIERSHLIGVSEGGSMVSLFAATYPERVQSLMIWGAQARWIASPDHPWGQTPEEHEEMLEMIRREWPSMDYIMGPGAGLGKDADPAALQRFARYLQAAASPSAVLAYEQMNAEIDTRPILPAISAPTLVMNRTGDPVAHVEAARDLASRIPGAKFVEYPGNVHAMMLDDMDTILDDIQEFMTGERPAAHSDRILATVVFLDIASSTERAAEMGDAAWRHVLDSYYRVVRKELDRFRGRETNTAGDGFLATFDGPARAVRCGLAIVQGVRQLGLAVRVGVHTGECELMGDNIGGIAVHIGARIMAKGEPGAVLVSSTVKDLVAGAGLDFRDAGSHALKGVPGEWRLFTATA
ncbi:MAG: adenylate/guanylate cyclase domain-containing protein [Fimbriimonas ginsengisoli]|uniref:Adenylate/guanylate cyclase domain-containing protein n=1 Tax=Fimbriimonas ginsengisoli TaxID=1005039 RepID=A0A931LWC4_FIMGI|nr:adenylate/guanylate cyclase domain-containing protein [Fimbriimonas ginsengisoli]